MSFRMPPILPSSSSGTLTGHASMQAPQPVHLSGSTYLARVTSRTAKRPFCRFTFFTVVFVRISMFGWLSTSYMRGASMQMEQSLVGKVLSSRAMSPPMLGVSSTRYTETP
jgi:hypothetical protein